MEVRIVKLSDLAGVPNVRSYQIDDGYKQLDMGKAEIRRHANAGHDSFLILDSTQVGKGTLGYAPYLVAWKSS